MKVCTKKDPGYDICRRISNARFDYFPKYICYCENPQDVRTAIDMAKKEDLRVRIRSGGHQHEGMCSGDDVLIIDLSKINHINFVASSGTAWIGAGAKLGDVYKQIFAKSFILPGGGCSDVRVGGLVQGGGWGLYSRAFGLTCDRLTAFRIVSHDGQEIEVNNPQSDLFWAVRGAGGGNFGVITEFRFELAPLSTPIWQFTVSWNDPALRRPVIEEWRQNFPADSETKLTSFCRVSGKGGEDPPVVVAGAFLGEVGPMDARLRHLLPSMYPKGSPTFTRAHEPGTLDVEKVLHHAEYQPGPPLAAMRAAPVSAALEVSAEGPSGSLSNTCEGGWFPHKVSSCFPRSGFSSAAAQSIIDYFDQSDPEPTARRYLSLHCMGGKINDQSSSGLSCFPFRDKPFMLQYQAWWLNPDDKLLEQRCLAWIRGFREKMKPHTEGAFINFPDKDLVPDPMRQRKELLSFYYAQNLEKLIGIKATYDPEPSFFTFEMSIPPR